MFAEVLLPQKVGKDKDTLTYEIPQTINPQIGMMVEVPLRKSKVKGIIFEIHDKKPAYPTKMVLNIVENAPHLQNWQIDTLKWLSDYYFCPLFKVSKLFLPVAFTKKKKT